LREREAGQGYLNHLPGVIAINIAGFGFLPLPMCIRFFTDFMCAPFAGRSRLRHTTKFSILILPACGQD
jgi:hypothetical protein